MKKMDDLSKLNAALDRLWVRHFVGELDKRHNKQDRQVLLAWLEKEAKKETRRRARQSPDGTT